MCDPDIESYKFELGPVATGSEEASHGPCSSYGALQQLFSLGGLLGLSIQAYPTLQNQPYGPKKGPTTRDVTSFPQGMNAEKKSIYILMLSSKPWA